MGTRHDFPNSPCFGVKEPQLDTHVFFGHLYPVKPVDFFGPLRAPPSRSLAPYGGSLLKIFLNIYEATTLSMIVLMARGFYVWVKVYIIVIMANVAKHFVLQIVG